MKDIAASEVLGYLLIAIQALQSCKYRGMKYGFGEFKKKGVQVYLIIKLSLGSIETDCVISETML